MQKKVGLAAVLVLLCGVSVYMWTSNTGEESDNKIVEKKEKWTCPHCGKDFELSVSEATAMMRTKRHEIVCPYCKEGGATRDDIVMTMGGGLPIAGGNDGNTDEADEEEEEEAPKPSGSMAPAYPVRP